MRTFSTSSRRSAYGGPRRAPVGQPAGLRLFGRSRPTPPARSPATKTSTPDEGRVPAQQQDQDGADPSTEEQGKNRKGLRPLHPRPSSEMSRKGTGERAVIPSPAIPRDARPAARGQAVECGQANQQARKVTGTMYTRTTA